MKIYFAERYVRNGLDEGVVIARDEEEANSLMVASCYDKDAYYSLEEIGTASSIMAIGIVTHMQVKG